MRELRLGDVIDDHCIKCRRVTNHSIVSIVSGAAAKVRCRTCYHDHDYRHEQAPPSKKELKKQELFREALAAAGLAGADGAVDGAALDIAGLDPAGDVALDLDDHPDVDGTRDDEDLHVAEDAALDLDGHPGVDETGDGAAPDEIPEIEPAREASWKQPAAAKKRAAAPKKKARAKKS